MSYKLLANRISRLNSVTFSRYQTERQYASKPKREIAPEIPVNPLKEVYGATYQKENGAVYDKKPFKILCEEGKIYHWCSCGHSKNQPFCDGKHNNIFLKIKLKPIKFTVTKTKEYWLCNCKQTANRPFCDGTHKREDLPSKTMY